MRFLLSLLFALSLLIAAPAQATTYSFIASQTAAGNGPSTAINTTGANLIVVMVSTQNNSPGVTDSLSNTWILATQNGGFSNGAIYYCSPCIVGSSHTFSIGGSFPSYGVMAFSGANSSPLDQSSSAGGNGVTSLQPGSITPSQNNELIITGTGTNTSGSPAVTGGFSSPISVAFASSVHYGMTMAYLIQTTATTENPTWSGQQYNAAAIASFEAPGNAPPGNGLPGASE